MSFANFIPTLWAEDFIRECERAHVFVADCTRKYEGQLKEMGDEVVIPSLVDPEIHTMTISQKNGDIGDPEFLSDTAVRVKADTIGYFNFAVSDIDKVQAKGDMFSEAKARAAYRMANEHDVYVSRLAASGDAPQLFTSAKKVVEGTAGEGEVNVLRLIDLCAQRLYENDVPDKTPIVATIPPRLRTMIKSEYLDKDTDNSEMMKNGYVGKYGNVILRVSNNVYSTGTGTSLVDKIMVRTQQAIAFVEQLSEVVPYQPEKKVGVDAIKGLSLYGGKIIRPRELIVADISY